MQPRWQAPWGHGEEALVLGGPQARDRSPPTSGTRVSYQVQPVWGTEGWAWESTAPGLLLRAGSAPPTRALGTGTPLIIGTLRLDLCDSQGCHPPTAPGLQQAPASTWVREGGVRPSAPRGPAPAPGRVGRPAGPEGWVGKSPFLFSSLRFLPRPPRRLRRRVFDLLELRLAWIRAGLSRYGSPLSRGREEVAPCMGRREKGEGNPWGPRLSLGAWAWAGFSAEARNSHYGSSCPWPLCGPLTPEPSSLPLTARGCSDVHIHPRIVTRAGHPSQHE